MCVSPSASARSCAGDMLPAIRDFAYLPAHLLKTEDQARTNVFRCVVMTTEHLKQLTNIFFLIIKSEERHTAVILTVFTK